MSTVTPDHPLCQRYVVSKHRVIYIDYRDDFLKEELSCQVFPDIPADVYREYQYIYVLYYRCVRDVESVCDGSPAAVRPVTESPHFLYNRNRLVITVTSTPATKKKKNV